MTRAITLVAGAVLILGVACGCKKTAKDAAEAPVEGRADTARGDAGGAAEVPSSGPIALTSALVTRVEVEAVDPEGAPARELYPDLLGKRVGATLGQSGYFYVDPAAVPSGVEVRPARVKLLVGYDFLPEGSEGLPAILAAIEARVVWNDGAPVPVPAMNVLAERTLRPGDDDNLDGIVAEHVERAAEDVARGLVAKEGLRVGPPALVHEALASDDPDLVIWALAMVGERRLGAATPAVIKVLAHADDRMRDAAIGALVALRDVRGVAPLTRLAEFSDLGAMRRVVDAVGAIGGSEAVDYLEFISTGHPDSDIQAQARAALDRLRAREP